MPCRRAAAPRPRPATPWLRSGPESGPWPCLTCAPPAPMLPGIPKQRKRPGTCRRVTSFRDTVARKGTLAVQLFGGAPMRPDAMPAADLGDLDPRTPVLAGVGQASERLGQPGYQRRSPADLAADAARAALAD